MKRHVEDRVRTAARWLVLAVGIATAASLPGPAWAQPAPAAQESWEVNVAPLYLWASSMSGEMAFESRTLPVQMDFGTAVKNLAGIFTFAGDARRGRVGVFADIGFVRLDTDATFEVPQGGGTVPVEGRIELDNVLFEAGGSVLVAPAFSLLAGVRTYTFSPVVSLDTVSGSIEPVDGGKTNVDGFGGVAYRPRLSPKWSLYTRADLGAGESAFTWSAIAAVEYRMKPFAGVLLGYKAYGIDTGDTLMVAGATSSNAIGTSYRLTQYGPVFAGTFHWGR